MHYLRGLSSQRYDTFAIITFLIQLFSVPFYFLDIHFLAERFRRVEKPLKFIESKLYKNINPTEVYRQTFHLVDEKNWKTEKCG